MPDHRRHRGPHPRDRELFAESQRAALAGATSDYGWLLGRGYASDAALKLVGDHYQLASRQRAAVVRAACSDAALAGRRQRHLAASALRGRDLAVDGFNCCITMEAALSGGVVLVGRDGAHRDLASVHGTYRRVLETPRALELLVAVLAAAAPAAVTWYFDRPVSNSGQLASSLRQHVDAHGLAWSAQLVPNPDRMIVESGAVALSADSWVLDHAAAWFDLAGCVIREHVPMAWLVDVSDPGANTACS